MEEADALRGLEAAGRLAALSPQTQAAMTMWSYEGLPVGLWVPSAFIQIGRAIASKRQPIDDKSLGRLFAEIERLMKSLDGVVANAVATDLLEPSRQRRMEAASISRASTAILGPKQGAISWRGMTSSDRRRPA